MDARKRKKPDNKTLLKKSSMHCLPDLHIDGVASPFRSNPPRPALHPEWNQASLAHVAKHALLRSRGRPREGRPPPYFFCGGTAIFPAKFNVSASREKRAAVARTAMAAGKYVLRPDDRPRYPTCS